MFFTNTSPLMTESSEDKNKSHGCKYSIYQFLSRGIAVLAPCTLPVKRFCSFITV